MKITIKKSIAINLLMFLMPISAVADIEVDKSSGSCIAYFVVIKKESGMRAALKLADNQDRAIFYANLKIDEVKNAMNNSSKNRSLAYEMNSSCRKIGLSPSNY